MRHKLGTDIMAEDIKALNKRLQWQIDNKGKGLHFIKLQNVSLSPLQTFHHTYHFDNSSHIHIPTCEKMSYQISRGHFQALKKAWLAFVRDERKKEGGTGYL
jgi:hypothetical protein